MLKFYVKIITASFQFWNRSVHAQYHKVQKAMMDQILNTNYSNAETQKNAGNCIKSNKCSQCEFASSQADSLRKHLKMYIGEKPIVGSLWEFEEDG